MARQISFSGQQPLLPQIFEHHTETEKALRRYFSSPANIERLTGYTEAEVLEQLDLRLAELDRSDTLTLFAAIEALFKIDFTLRATDTTQDDLTRAFQILHEKKGPRVSLDKEIFEEWKKHTTMSKKVLGQLKAAFHYRDWLAHGRYWIPNLGQQYDYQSIAALAQIVDDQFPLLR